MWTCSRTLCRFPNTVIHYHYPSTTASPAACERDDLLKFCALPGRMCSCRNV